MPDLLLDAFPARGPGAKPASPPGASRRHARPRGREKTFIPHAVASGEVVLARRVGKPRSFGRGLALTVFTVGLYALYWNYKAHDEVYRQFELDDEGRDEGVLWYVLGVVLFAPLFVYMWVFAANVAHVRARMGLPRGATPRAFVTTTALGFVAYFAGAIWLTAALLALPADATDEQIAEAAGPRMPAFLLGALAFVVLVPAAYLRLQRDLNGLWAAYDRRAAELTAPPIPPPASAAPAAGAPTYFADLARPPPREP